MYLYLKSYARVHTCVYMYLHMYIVIYVPYMLKETLGYSRPLHPELKQDKCLFEGGVCS